MSTSEYTTTPMFRQCSQCKNEYPLSVDYFYPNKKNRYGLKTSCKVCDKAKAKRWHAENVEKTREIKRKSREKHQERYNAELRRRWREDMTFRKKHSGRTKLWKSRNVDQNNALQRKRRDTPYHRMQNRLAQQRRKENTNVTEEQIHEMWEELQGRCAYCGVSIFIDGNRDVTIEHIVPITRGGTDNPENLTLICHLCNCSKNNRLYEEWVKVRGW